MILNTEDIEKAAKQCADDYAFANYGVDREEQLKEVFKTGATWGVQRATKDLWHDVSEKPSLKHGESVSLLYQYQNEGDEEIIDSTFTYSWFEDWNVYAALYGIRRWCKIADILPQKD